MQLLTIRQLTTKLGVDRATVYRWIKAGILPPASERRNNTAFWNSAAVDSSLRRHNVKLRVPVANATHF